jgi:hypothetical protein
VRSSESNDAGGGKELGDGELHLGGKCDGFLAAAGEGGNENFLVKFQCVGGEIMWCGAQLLSFEVSPFLCFLVSVQATVL